MGFHKNFKRPGKHGNADEGYRRAIGMRHLLGRLVTSLSPEARAAINNVPRMLSRSFFERLLRNDINIKSCPGRELSGAQRDLRYLSLEQLLSIWGDTSDFRTQSSSHEAHSNFLSTLEFNMYKEMAHNLLRSDKKDTADALQLNSLGKDMALLLGAACQSNKHLENPQDATVLSPPLIWGVKLDGSLWPGQVGYIHINELWVEVLDANIDFSEIVGESQVHLLSREDPPVDTEPDTPEKNDEKEKLEAEALYQAAQLELAEVQKQIDMEQPCPQEENHEESIPTTPAVCETPPDIQAWLDGRRLDKKQVDDERTGSFFGFNFPYCCTSRPGLVH